jgi:hypothetical protein
MCVKTSVVGGMRRVNLQKIVFDKSDRLRRGGRGVFGDKRCWFWCWCWCDLNWRRFVGGLGAVG